MSEYSYTWKEICSGVHSCEKKLNVSFTSLMYLLEEELKDKKNKEEYKHLIELCEQLPFAAQMHFAYDNEEQIIVIDVNKKLTSLERKTIPMAYKNRRIVIRE